jgi:hypothetical protein
MRMITRPQKAQGRRFEFKERRVAKLGLAADRIRRLRCSCRSSQLSLLRESALCSTVCKLWRFVPEAIALALETPTQLTTWACFAIDSRIIPFDSRNHDQATIGPAEPRKRA